MTAIVTGERGDGTLTRYGLEEYVSDCVILLDHRVTEQISTRRLRVVKYRGSTHGTNEFPFLIDENGISVVPITSADMDHPAFPERVSSGVAGLDEMLGGKGFYRGSSVLISGTAGTGKTSIAALFARAACMRGERCLYFSFEESQQQLVRNMKSIGLDLDELIRKNLLSVHSARPTLYGLEMHLAQMLQTCQRRGPEGRRGRSDQQFHLGRHHDGGRFDAGAPGRFAQEQGITSVFTNLTHGETAGRTRTSASPRSSIPGCCCVMWNRMANGAASSTSSSRGHVAFQTSSWLPIHRQRHSICGCSSTALAFKIIWHGGPAIRQQDVSKKRRLT